jgi:hypothetical protein
MKTHRHTCTHKYLWSIILLAVLVTSGCNSIPQELIDRIPEIINAPDAREPVQEVRPPVDPMSVPESGEFAPDPVNVLYQFRFDDGTQVIFREVHTRDHWGYYPEAGFGQIIWPDGRKEAFDANRKIRHGGLIGKKLKTPVTTLDHGKRMFWMADAEERKDVKKVTIFEDGWNPLVESALLGTQEDIGVTANLVEAEVTVEKRK